MLVYLFLLLDLELMKDVSKRLIAFSLGRIRELN